MSLRLTIPACSDNEIIKIKLTFAGFKYLIHMIAGSFAVD